MVKTRVMGAERMHSRRVRSTWSIIERLEGRYLPSAASLVHFAYIDHLKPSAELASTTIIAHKVRISLEHTDGSGQDDPSKTGRTGSGKIADPPPAGRDGTVTTEEGRLARYPSTAAREFSDPLELVTRRIDPTTDLSTNDPPATGQELVPGQNSGAAFDSADASSAVGWAPAGAVPLMMPTAILAGSFVGTDGRARPSAGDSMPPGSAGNVASELALPGLAQNRPRMPQGLDGNEPAQLVGLAVTSDRAAPAWATLLEGALRPDWEVVDRELRQFLSGLHSLAGETNRSGTGPIWPLAIGVALALVLARRASFRRQRMFQRPVPGLLPVSGRRPVTFGPWPTSLR
jgi:hypothetical protein